MTPTPSQGPPIPQGGGGMMGYDHDHGRGGGGCFSFGGTVQCIEESNIYLCFVVCRLKKKKREDWLLDRICESKKDCWDSIRRTSYPYQ